MRFLNIRQLKHKIKRDPKGFFSRCTPMERALLNLLFYWDSIKESFSEYQERMAALIGCTLDHVNKMISKFSKLGILQKSGPYNKKQTYVLNPYFHRIGIRRLLSGIFETFSFYSKRIVFSLCLIVLTKANSLSTKFNLKSGSDYITHARARHISSGNALDKAPQATLLGKKEIQQNKQERKKVISESKVQAIMEINESFPLTTHGIVKLSAYSLLALRYVSKQTHMALGKYDPFGYLASVCDKFDKKSGYAIDWEAYHLRREALGIAKEDTIFMDQERLSAMELTSKIELTQESKPTYAKTPVKKTHKQVKPAEWVPAHESMEVEEKMRNKIEAANRMIVNKDERPKHNSEAFFASLLLGNKPSETIETNKEKETLRYLGHLERAAARKEDEIADKIFVSSLSEQIYIDPLDEVWEEVL